ncbi:MAG: protein kinase [Nannocystaceae bacterium]|nr:protein kinase [Nannocystaceae bacterium]
MVAASQPCPSDAQLAALVDGSASAVEARRLRSHLDHCESCTELVAHLVRGTAPVAAPPTLLEPGARVGRYVVRAVLGAGAMGVVYRAHDPELQRELALKLVRPRAIEADALMERLRRESRALARLRDPHVIAVHDIGVLPAARADRAPQIFIAMEYVDGTTLRRWLERPRPWREVVAMFVQAGRGLAAAHRAGLVHRDFKPDNVLVGHDGRAQVTDFGLARALDDVPSGTRELEQARALDVDTPSGGAATLTQTGARVGTPLYMAPEQIEGAEVGPAADQFAFAVSLFEALGRQRPFAGATVAALFDNVLAGNLRSVRWPAPGYLLRALQRALAVDPRARHRDMDALIVALQRDVRPRRLALASLALAATTVGAWAWSSHAAREAARAACGREAVLAAWSPDRRDAVAAAMAEATDYGGDVFERIAPRLDAWAQQYRSLREAACLHAELEPTATPQTRALAQRCYDDHASDVAHVVDRLERPDAQLLARATQLVTELAPASECDDPRWLEQHVAPLLEGDDAAARAELRRELDRAKTAFDAGAYDDAAAAIEALYARVDDSEDLALRAAVALQRALVLRVQRDAATAEQATTEAFHLAMRARDDEHAARAAIELLELTGVGLADATKSEHWAALAASTLSRMDPPPPRLEVMRLRNLGLVAARHRRLLEARTYFALGLDYARRELGESSPHVVSLLSNVASNAMARGELDDGIARLREVVARREADLGPRHPTLAGPLINLGNALQMVSDHEGALQSYARAEALCRAQSLPQLAALLSNRAHVHLLRGDTAAALRDMQEALALDLERHPPDHPDVIEARYSLARVALDRGELALARPQLDTALAAVPEARDRALHLRIALELGRLERLEGDAAAALTRLDGIAAGIAAAAPDLSLRLARLRAESLHALARDDEAIAALAAATATPDGGDAVESVAALRLLAQLVEPRDGDRARGLRQRADAIAGTAGGH